MQYQMPINAPSLMTNLLKDAAKVESIDYSAEFEFYILEWTIYGNFLMISKCRLI